MKYRIRLKVVDPKTGRRLDVERLVVAATEGDASLLREELRRDLESESAVPERLRFRDYAMWLLRGKRKTVRKTTLRTYADRLDNACDAFGEFYLDALTRQDLEAWRDEQTDAPETVNGRLRVLRMLFKQACAEGLVDRDPCALVVSLPRRREGDVDDHNGKCLEPDELRALLASIEELRPKWYPLLLTLAVTGMRWGEATALKWPDVDLEARYLYIRRAHVRGEVDDPKTAASRRRLPVPEQLVVVLKAFRVQQLRDQSPGLVEGWVFPSRTGGLMGPSSARKPLLAAALALGWAWRDEHGKTVGRVPSPHWFRHTLNRLLRRASEGVVQRSITGHVTQAMAEHYDSVAMPEKAYALAMALRPVFDPSTGVDPSVDKDND